MKTMKKSMMKFFTLALASFVLINVGFASQTPSCLSDFWKEEIQKMETIEMIFNQNTTVFETKFPGSRSDVQTFTQEIKDTLHCKNGYKNFDAFKRWVANFINTLLAKKTPTLPQAKQVNLEYSKAVADLQNNLSEFFALGMEKNTFETSAFKQNINFGVAVDNTSKQHKNAFIIKGALLNNWKIDTTKPLLDTTIKGELAIEGSESYTVMDPTGKSEPKVITEWGAVNADIDATIKLDSKNIFVMLNDLNATIKSNNPFINAVAQAKLKEIKEKLLGKNIHLPLPEEFGKAYAQQMMLQNTQDIKIFKIIDNGTATPYVVLDKNICDVFVMQYQNKNNCAETVKEVNQSLKKISTITKNTDGSYTLTFDARHLPDTSEGSSDDTLSLVRNEKKILAIKGTIAGTTINYENNFLHINNPKLFNIEGAFNPQTWITLTLTDLNPDDEVDFNGHLSTTKDTLHIDAQIETRGFENNTIIIDVTMKNLFKKISPFTIQQPEHSLELHEVEKLFNDIQW